MSRPQAQALANARFRLDYDLTLMTPVASYDLPADGKRHQLSGLGECSFKSGAGKGSEKLVTCRLSGAAPAMVLSRVAGHAAKQSHTDYAPDGLRMSREAYDLDVAPPHTDDAPAAVTAGSSVSLTVYAAKAHVHRRVLAPSGAMGGPAATCPF